MGPKSNDPNVCASAEVAATRVIPTVLFVIDGSGSMNAPFGNGTRWSVLREALVGPTGVITKLEGIVEFGMSIYSSARECPGSTHVPPKIQNLMALSSAYPAQELGGGTPTGEALQKVVDGLADFNPTPDSTPTAPIIILATDGEPNGCGPAGLATCDWTDVVNCLGMLAGMANAPATYDTTLAAARAARAKNIPLWVLSLADGLASIPQLQTTANIGAGVADDASPGAPIYSPQNTDDLVQTLSKLIGAVVSCDVELNGTLNVSRACEGAVKINGADLGCNDPQGWKPLDESHISLQGTACDRFKSDPAVLLTANFPCGVILQ